MVECFTLFSQSPQQVFGKRNELSFLVLQYAPKINKPDRMAVVVGSEAKIVVEYYTLFFFLPQLTDYSSLLTRFLDARVRGLPEETTRRVDTLIRFVRNVRFVSSD